MATIKSKQLNPNLTGSFAVSGSFDVTGPLTATTFVGMLSSSAQIASDISGSFTDTSASFSVSTTNATASIAGLVADSGSFSTRITTDSGSISTRLTTEEANVDALQVDSGSFSVRVTDTETTASSLINDFSTVQSLGTTDSVKFDAINTTGDVTVRGNIIAETYIVSSSITRLTSSFSSGSTIFGDTLDDTHQFTGSLTVSSSNLTIDNLGRISGSSVSTGSFGKVESNTSDVSGDITIGGDATVEGDATINGNLFVDSTIQHKDDTDTRINFTNNRIRFKAGDITFVDVEKGGSSPHHVLINPGGNNIDFKVEDNDGEILFQTDADSDNVLFPKATKVSGSSTSTGSFGNLRISDMSVSDIGLVSSSFSSRITTAEDELSNTLISSSAQIATDISGSLGENADLIRTLTAAGISGSSGFSAGLSPAIISGSWQGALSGSLNIISGSATSTGSFGRIEANIIEAQRFVVSSSVTNITTIDISGSTNFGDSSDDRHSFTGSLFIPSGSLEGELYIDTNESKMFIGKYSGGIEVSGSANASRYVTTSDGSLIDLGFTTVNDDGVTVITGIGDGLYSDPNNYWYNNSFFKLGSATQHVRYDAGLNTLKVRGDLVATTGSYFGEMNINTGPSGSMYVGKNSKGIPVSGSSNMSRFVTGSDGSVVDIGFITVDEDGNESFLTTGDGLVRNSNNYWYNTGHFKLGDANQYIEWDNTDLNISGSSNSTASFGFYANISASVAAAGFGSGGGGGGSSFTATGISGSFTSVSASLAARITVEEAEGGGGGGGSFTAAGISGSFQGGGSNLISGSSTSTGSFGRLETAGAITANGLVNINSSFAQLRLSDDNFSDFISLGQSGPVGYIKTSDADNDFKFRRGSDNTDVLSIDFGNEEVTASGDFLVQGQNIFIGGGGGTDEVKLIHNGDTDTHLLFDANKVNLVAGGKSAIKYDATAGKIIINNTNQNVDFHVMANDGEEILATDAANNRVGINTTTPGVALEVVGSISGSSTSTGSFGRLETSGAATIGGKFSLPNISDVSASLAAAVAGGDNLGNHTATQDINLDGNSIKSILHVTASGNISGSSTSTGSFGNIVTNTRDVYRYGVQAISDAAETNPAVDGRGGGILIENLNSAGSAMLRMRGGDGISRILYGENNSTDEFKISPRNQTQNVFKMDSVGDITVPGNITLPGTGTNAGDGNVSGSATSTGSFGAISVGGGHFTSASLAAGGSGGSSAITALNNATENELVTVGSTTTELDAEANLTFASGKLEISGVAYPNLRVVGGQLGYLMVGDTGATSNFQNYQLVSDGGNFEVRRVNDAVSSVLETPFKIEDDSVEISGNISGSSNSTGSFGYVNSAGNLNIEGGYFSLFNKGSQSQIRLYCEVNNAHYVGLQAPPHAEFGGNPILTLPPTTDTLVGRTTTDTLTNKTLTSPDINGGTIDDVSRVSGSAASTGSFGRVTVPTAKNGVNIGVIPSNWTSELNILGTQSTTGIKIQAPSSGNAQIKFYSNNGGSNNDFWYIQATNGGTFDIVNYGPGSFTNMVSIAGNTGNTTVRGSLTTGGNVSGSATSTGSFGALNIDGGHFTSASLAAGGGGGSDDTSWNDGTATRISGSATSTGSFGNVESPLNGRIIGNLTELIRVTVVSDGGNHYAFEGATAPSLQVSEGKIYRFDISDSTVGSHPFRFSTVQDGSHGGGSPYTTGVTVVGTQGQAGAYVELQVTKATVNHLYYYCTAHPGMGNDGKIMKNDLTNLHMVSGSSISTGSFGIIENNTQIAGFRPIINQTANFSASLSNAGRYHIVHGNLTCSIGTDSDMPVTVGAEYEFFQSSSLGNFLFESGSGVSLISKNDNMNIAGQGSGATLKKVAANTFHLVGDLT